MLLTSLLMTFSLFYSSISDRDHSDQCRLFVRQGGVEHLNGFLPENSPERHRNLALLIMDNIKAWQNRQL